MAAHHLIISLLLAAPAGPAENPSGLCWPPPPDTARVIYIGEIRCDQLAPGSGLLGKLTRFIGGKSADERLSHPFDVAVRGRSLFMVCQNIAALVEVDRDDMTFKLHECKENPFVYPVSLCEAGGDIYIADPEARTVYRFSDGRVSAVIDQGLIRPTGIAVLPAEKRVYIVDTGDHRLKIFDLDGRMITVVPEDNDSTVSLLYPTFAAAWQGRVLVNDGLNYRIRQFDAQGNQIMTFGREGDGPGCFARPKGLAVDSDGHIYVVDNIFDNIQIFDAHGRLLLVVGSSGKEPGRFWSPAGIDIVNDTIYVADVFNNRVQVLRYLGDGR